MIIIATINIPYGRTFLEAQIPDDRLAGVLVSKAHHYIPEANQESLVRQALEHPIGSPKLCDLVKNKNKIVIIASDHTRPVPSRILAPLLLAEIRKGNSNADITFLIATGFHRATTKQELIEKFGEEIVATEKIVIHDSSDAATMCPIGKLPSGGDLIVNKLAIEADLLLAEGFIEPHFFAGFSGGRKSVLPGIVSRVTVLANHCAGFIANPQAKAGMLENNPLHIDMLYAAKAAKLSFILNVIIDADKKIIKAFAGDREEAHRYGCDFAAELATVAAKPANIIITSNGGYPLDQNIYQTVKSMAAAENSCLQGGVIIICAACNYGHGGEAFYRWFADASTAQEVMDKIVTIPAERTIADQWQAQILARILIKHTVIIVTDQCDHEMIVKMKMKAAKTLPEALVMAEAIVGKESQITVIPDGVSVIVK